MKIPFHPPTHAEHTPFITSNGVRANACSHRHIKALFHVQLSRHFIFTTASIDIYKQTNTQSRMNRHSFTHAYYSQDHRVPGDTVSLQSSLAPHQGFALPSKLFLMQHARVERVCTWPQRSCEGINYWLGVTRRSHSSRPPQSEMDKDEALRDSVTADRLLAART